VTRGIAWAALGYLLHAGACRGHGASQPEAVAGALAVRPMEIDVQVEDVALREAVDVAGRTGALVAGELRLSLHNPADKQVGGHVTMTLPMGSRIVGMALQVGAVWRDAVVVRRARGVAVFEQIVDELRDPALLTAAGELLDLRVFPFAPRETRRVGLRYVGFAAEAGETVAARDGERVIARVQVGDLGPSLPVGDLTILVDSSGSMGPHWRSVLTALEGALAELGAAGATVEVIAFDDRAVPIYRGPAATAGPPVTAALRRRETLGSTDLVGAFAGLVARAPQRLLLISDGGRVLAPASVSEGVAALGRAGTRRIDVLAFNDEPGDSTAGAVGHAADVHLPEPGLLVASRAQVSLARALAVPVLRDVAVTVPGSRRSWPQQRARVQLGDSFLVHAELPAGTPPTVRIAEGPAIRVPTQESPGAAFDHLWWAGIVDAGLAVEPRTPAEDERLLELSLQHGVLNALTALLALESDADERRFAVQPRSAEPRRSGESQGPPPPAERSGRPRRAGGEQFKEIVDWNEKARQMQLRWDIEEILSARSSPDERASRLEALLRKEFRGEPLDPAVQRALHELCAWDRPVRDVPRLDCARASVLRLVFHPPQTLQFPAALTDPEGRWPDAAPTAIALAKAWSARGDAERAGRALQSLQEFGVSDLALALAVDASPGGGASGQELLRQTGRVGARLLALSQAREGAIEAAWNTLAGAYRADPSGRATLEPTLGALAGIRSDRRTDAKIAAEAKALGLRTDDQLLVVAHVVVPPGVGCRGCLRLRLDDPLRAELGSAASQRFSGDVGVAEIRVESRVHLPGSLVVEHLEPGTWARVDVVVPGAPGPWVTSHLVSQAPYRVPLPVRVQARGLCQ
jgi:hypothetical protein